MKTHALVVVFLLLFVIVRSEAARAQETKETAMSNPKMEMDDMEMDSTGGSSLQAMLSGSNEVPDKADPDGSGEAEFTVNADSAEICYDLSVANIGEATGAHIHHAAAGKNGPVVLKLQTPGTDGSEGCVEASGEVIEGILASPGDYYVNVHNAEFPGGAIRGQLSTMAMGK